MANRVLRLSAATLVLGAAGAALLPHATSYVATAAVVNAPLVLIKAPFDGIVSKPSADIAEPVEDGDELMTLNSDRADRAGLAALEAERKTLIGERDSLTRLDEELTTLTEALMSRRTSHIEQFRSINEARVAAAVAAEEEARIRLTQLRADMERNAKLARSGSVAAKLLKDDQADVEAADMALARASAERRAIELEGQAMDDGVVLDDAGGGYSQISYRLDEIAIRRAEMVRQKIEIDARLSAVSEQIATLNRRAELRESFTPVAGSVGVIWKASPPEGSAVMTGDEVVRLLDCSRRFIEVSVPERHFEQIRIGSPATVQLKGSSNWFTAEVEAVRGAGGRFDRPALAAMATRDDRDQLSVIVRLPVAEVSRPEVAHAFCDVGRTADVRFGRSPTDLRQQFRRAWDGVAARASALQSWMTAQAHEAD